MRSSVRSSGGIRGRFEPFNLIGQFLNRSIFSGPGIARAVAGLALAGVAAIGISSGARAQTDLNEELQCLALNIYFEARSEPESGRRAVGHVVMNRVASPRYPNTVCDVVRQGGERLNRCQFSWWCDGLSDVPRQLRAWSKSVDLAYEIYVGISQDPTAGALWYHADYVNPIWGKILKRNRKIGLHIFYAENENAKVSWARPNEIDPGKKQNQVAQLGETLTLDPTI